MSRDDNVRSQSHFLELNPLTPTGASKFFFLPLAKYIVNAAIGNPFYELSANEMLLYAHLYNLSDQTRRKQGNSFLDEKGRVYILPDTYEMSSFLRSSGKTVLRTLKMLQAHEMIDVELDRYTRRRIIYVKESFPEDENEERIIPNSPQDLPYMQGRAPSMRGFYKIPLTLCGRRGERKNVYSQTMTPETILIYSILLDTALSALSPDAYIESETQPFVYVRYGYEALAKRLHIAKAGKNERIVYSHSTLSNYIRILEGDGTWSGLIRHTRNTNESPGLGNLRGYSNYTIRDYSVTGLEEGFFLESEESYLKRMETEAVKANMEADKLIRYGRFGYGMETAGMDEKERPSIVVTGEEETSQEPLKKPISSEEDKTGHRDGQNWTSKGTKSDIGANGQNWTSKGTKLDIEGDNIGHRDGQNRTPKGTKLDSNNKDNLEKDNVKKDTVYISSSSQESPEILTINPQDIEILDPEEEENTITLHRLDPDAPGAREALENYHRNKQMRCPFDEFWRFNENKGWMVNGERVKDVVALLSGYENRYVKEHPMGEILIQDGFILPEGADDMDRKRMRLYESVMANCIY